MKPHPEFDQFDRLPPHSIDAEMCVLGALLMCGEDAQVYSEATALLKPDSFYLTDHSAIYAAIVAQREASGQVDAILVRERLRSSGHLEEVGGVGYFGELLGKVPSYHHAAEYARAVAREHALRQIITAASQALADAYGQATDPTEIAGNLGDVMLGVSSAGVSDRVITMADAVATLRDSLARGQPRRIPTGIKSVDTELGGIPIGKFSIIAGRPSMGKSLLAKQIARNVARTGMEVGIVSIEEDRLKIAENAVASESLIDNRKINQAKLTPDELEQVNAASDRVEPLPIFIVDTVTTISDVEAAITTLTLRHHCKLVIVDHIHLIDGEMPRGSNDRTREVTKISGRLKACAKRLGIAFIACAQLSRGSEQGEEKPKLSDLRDSGALEQDADLVMILYRADYYNQRRDPANFHPDHKLEIGVRKNRDGRCCDIVVECCLKTQWVFDPDERQQPAAFVSQDDERARVAELFGGQ